MGLNAKYDDRICKIYSNMGLNAKYDDRICKIYSNMGLNAKYDDRICKIYSNMGLNTKYDDRICKIYSNMGLNAKYDDRICKIYSNIWFNPFPNKPWFLRVCSTSLLKTLWEKEKLLVTSNFSFSHSVFYPFGEPSAIFIKFKICRLQTL